MKAFGTLEVTDISNSNSIIPIEIPDQRPVGHDLLVQVKAVSVNPVDTKVRNARNGRTNGARIVGYDASGIVKAIGEKVTLFKPGDEIYYAGDITRKGTNADQHLVDERIVARKPKTLDFLTAAGMPLTSITAYEALFDRLPFRAQHHEENTGKRLLIINGAGGVGSIAVQLAKWAGLHVTVTASRPETVQWVKDLGADEVINHRNPFKDEFEKLPFDTVDAILCLNNTKAHWQNMDDVIKPQGHICSIVEIGEDINLDLIKSKSTTFSWESMFTRSAFETEDIIEQHKLLTKIAALLDSGVIKQTVTKKLTPLNAENLREAHKLIESGRMIGKVVVGEN
ncbi:zinc-binding alcohol dehydrogenase family protein [Sporolactobacillus shoreicorticis]|uniref:Zinc-type alcohol dehydrogenase-like protein n=1 Tax=Sporolactobacillus shoreicorticis TaxID=1923877 RepID=A0ABW5RZK0_9BACL|nr:zinc-binding alcohol dehydrogenase family protein [Sporolactobacillus shoreicorticis]MCO7127230.1 zinc-binding alcohol dehydrogenase family protein [Sporolactobacillus shoreicorticis]